MTHHLLSRADDPGSEPFLHIHNLITSQPANKERRQQIAKEASVLHSSYGLFEEEDRAVLLAFFYRTAPIAFLWTLDFIQACQKSPDSKVHTAVQPFTYSLAKAHCHFAPIRNRPQVRRHGAGRLAGQRPRHHISLQATWTKGGRPREVPITTASQRQALDGLPTESDRQPGLYDTKGRSQSR